VKTENVPIEATDARYHAEEKRFSVCTLATDWKQYQAMLDTFRAGGFSTPDTEFLYLDNSLGNCFDGFSGLNLFLNIARGRRVILCHQESDCSAVESTHSKPRSQSLKGLIHNGP
jgi:hypothetical protein